MFHARFVKYECEPLWRLASCLRGAIGSRIGSMAGLKSLLPIPLRYRRLAPSRGFAFGEFESRPPSGSSRASTVEGVSAAPSAATDGRIAQSWGR